MSRVEGIKNKTLNVSHDLKYSLLRNCILFLLLLLPQYYHPNYLLSKDHSHILMEQFLYKAGFVVDTTSLPRDNNGATYCLPITCNLPFYRKYFLPLFFIKENSHVSQEQLPALHTNLVCVSTHSNRLHYIS